tara:strand:- start:119 stop:1693 length:1575 start_codon:yes stop_codon:yes gene_type:complete
MSLEKTKVLLGSISIIHSDWLPYAAGCLISYCRTIPEIEDKFEFMDPIYQCLEKEDYKKMFMEVDILGLTCYVWNQAYNDELAMYYKELRPDGVVIFGGPEVPEDADAKVIYDEREFLHTSVAGLGEIAFGEWLLGMPRSHAVLTDMPTPYTDGVFDNLLATGDTFKVSFETNRGCPYSCAFCDWGGQAKSKLTRFNPELIYDTIDFIYKHDNINELEILDANFGIQQQDVDVIDYMIDRQTHYDNPLRISYSGLAKNGSKHLPSILSKIFGQIPIDQRNLKISFQTHTPEVLEVIQRSNINNDRLIPLITEYKIKNIPTTSEMIIGLPGETADSWLRTLHHNYHILDIDYVRTYILHIINNTEMNSRAYRDKYNMTTKTIQYKSQEVQILNSCYSFDVNELVQMFRYNWFYHNLINTDIIKDQIVDVYDDCIRFFDHIDEMPFLNSLIERQSDLVSRFFSIDPVTRIEDDNEHMWFAATLRLDDITMMINNCKQVEDELSNVFNRPNLLWECDNPKSSVATIR